jgi:hypothetical protein
MKKLISVLMFVALFAGCAGSRSYSKIWEQGGSLRIAEPDSPSHDYKFYIQAGRDFGVNTQDRNDRVLMIKGYLDETCSDVIIVEEQFLPSGGTALGDLKLGTFVSKVKCIKSS